MKRTTCGAIFVLVLILSAGPSAAQGLFDGLFGGGERRYERRGYERDYGRRGYGRDEDWNSPGRDQFREQSRRTEGGDIRQGGGRPTIAAQAPPIVAFNHDYPLNSIVIDTGSRKLYYVLPDGRAYEYAISVGREGFNWTGNEVISRKQEWPDWYPPAEMRERDRSLPVKMTGGLKNPLGALALYLGDTLYRIHGTNDAKSIGRAASSGCFRMLNAHILHLASVAAIGTQVNVVATLPGQPTQPKVSEGPAVAPPSTASAPQPTGASAPQEVTEAKRKEDERRAAVEAEAKRIAEAKLLEAERKQQEATEAKRMEDERRAAVEAEAKRIAEGKRLEAERKQQEATEAKRKQDEQRAAAKIEARRIAEAKRLEAERKQQEATEAKRKEDEQRVAAKEEAKRIAEAKRLEAERKQQEATEAKRKEDEQRVAAKEEAKRIAEAKRLEAERKQQEATKAKRKEDEQRAAAVVEPRRAEAQRPATERKEREWGTGTTTRDYRALREYMLSR